MTHGGNYPKDTSSDATGQPAWGDCPTPHEDCGKVIVKSNGAINACLHIIKSRTSRMSSLSRPEDVSDGPMVTTVDTSLNKIE